MSGKSRDRLGLWRQYDFRQLFWAQSISQFGTQVTLVVLPVIAVSVLAAGPFEMGVLVALESAAFLLIALPAGAWVDRRRVRRVLWGNDVIRAVTLLSLPLAYLFDRLTLVHLFVVALVLGFATVFFDIAYQSCLPALVGKTHLVEANAKLEISRTIAYVGGPGLAGAALRVISAPLLILIQAFSFLASAWFIRQIRSVDTAPDRATRGRLRTEIGEGLAFVVGHPLLRRIVMCTGIGNLFNTAGGTLLVIYVIRVLGYDESAIGLVFSIGAIGGVLAALCTTLVTRWLGEGPAIAYSAVLLGAPAALIPLAQLLPAPLVWVTLAWIGLSFSVVVYNVVQVSFRQRLCPPELLGRMNASVRFLVWGTMPIGGLLGGALGSWIGVTPTLWVVAAGSLMASFPVLLSPLRTMRQLPDAYDALT